MTPGLATKQALVECQSLLAAYGGLEGLRAPEGLESALAQPLSEVFGQMRFPTPAAQAAAYLFLVVQAHAFVDGNKRTGAALCLTWLDLHDLVVLDDVAFETLVREVASGQRTVDRMILRLEALAKPEAAHESGA